MTEQMYYIWLSQSFTWGDPKQFDIAKKFNNLEQLYNMSAEEMQRLSFLTPQDISSLKRTSMERVEKIVYDCNNLGIEIITIRDELFPRALFNIYAPPIVLYYKGNISKLNSQLIIAMVGTRNIDDYSRKITYMLSRDLTKAGALVISGGAVGVDSVAHAGALDENGRTMTIMGCGIDINYPKENAKQRDEILYKNGALISELPPKSPVLGKYFPTRNRIIAGLAQGVCVTHVPIRSGASITATYAVDQGKDLFCVPPWDITDSRCMGVMKFIREGCIVVGGADDILNEYSTKFVPNINKFQIQSYNNNPNHISQVEPNTKLKSKPKPKKEAVENIENTEIQESHTKPNVDLKEVKIKQLDYYNNLDDEKKKIYECLSETPKLLDDIILESQIPITKALSLLTDLEMDGVVLSHNGRRYSLNLSYKV